MDLRALQIGMTASAGAAGGADRYYFSLLQALASDGIRASGLVTGDPGDVAGMTGVQTYARETDSLLRRCLKLRSAATPAIAANDVVVSHFAQYGLTILDRLRGKPFVVHFHGPWALESQAEGAGAFSVAVKRGIERTVYRAAARVIVLSSAFGDIVTNEYGISAGKVRVIPGGVDLERFGPRASRAQARERLGLPGDRPTVVTVRRLVHAKGVDNLVKAAALVRERVPNLFVAIAGAGPLAGALQASIDEMDLSGTVRMLGRVVEEDLPLLYRAADLLIVPTVVLEGFGLVVLEALAAGTPALVTPVGGLPEVVRSLDPSLVLEGHTPEQLAGGITGALLGQVRVPSEAECLAYASRFAWTDIAHRVGDVYREVALKA